MGKIVEEQGGMVGMSHSSLKFNFYYEISRSFATALMGGYGFGWSSVDNIESNIVAVNTDVTSAGEELRTAHEYQRKAGKRMLCLMMILIVVGAVVLLAVSREGRRCCGDMREELICFEGCRSCPESRVEVTS